MVKKTIDRESRGRYYERAFKNAPMAIAILNGPRHVYVFSNKENDRLLGSTTEVGKTVEELLPLKNKKGIIKILNHVYKTGTAFYKEARVDSVFKGDQTERYIIFTYQPLMNEKNKVDGILCLAYDITKEVLGRKRLKESEERYRTFIEQSTEGIWRFELKKPIPIKLSVEEQLKMAFKYAYLAECNDAMAKMYGFQSAKNIVGLKLVEIMIPTDKSNVQTLTHFLNSGYRIINAESHEVDKNGNDVYFLNNFVGIIEDGHVVRAWGTQKDITEQKKLEKEKDEFIGIATHELKTPVTSVKAYTQILYRKFISDGDQKTAEVLYKMDTQINKLSELINDLLDVTKIQEGKLKLKESYFDFNELVREVVDEMQPTTEIHKIIVNLGKTKSVFGDRDRIGQVITNLISNAIKYTPKAGKITIKSIIKSGNMILSVKDSGVGISKENKNRIFERLFRGFEKEKETYPGLGLGLYISKEIIERHGGRIWVDSKPGKGSKFYFSLLLNK